MKLTIGKRVKELRVKNKMTQEQLAEAVDACVAVSYTHLDVYKRQVLFCPVDDRKAVFAEIF